MGYLGQAPAPQVATSVDENAVDTAAIQDDAVTDTKIATLSGDLNFGDNAKAIFGASNDLEIYHDGSNSYISDEGAGTLRVRSSNQLVLQVGDDAGGWENAILANNNAGVELRYNNSGKLATTGTGVAVTGDLTATGNVTAYYSDDRLKNNLGKIENALEKVESLEGFYYEANETAQALGYKATKEVGVSAQSVEKIMPEVVAPAPIDEQYLTIRYERLVPLLIESIKELSAEVKRLKGQ